MKISAIVRICIWSFVALLLTGVLVGVLALNMLPEPSAFFDKLIDSGINISSWKYADSDSYTTAESGAVELSEQINNINIDWLSGDVTVKKYDGEKIKFSENSDGLKDEELMRYRVDRNTLYIQFYKSKLSNLKGLKGKSLELLIPNNYETKIYSIDIESVSADCTLENILSDNIEIETVSGSIFADKITSGEIGLNSVSGNIKAIEIVTDDLEVESISGKCEVTSSFKSCSFESASGDLYLTSLGKANEINLETVSGKMELFLPKNAGFTASLESVSGKISSTFPTTGSSKKMVCGDAYLRIDCESVSGDLNLSDNSLDDFLSFG